MNSKSAQLCRLCLETSVGLVNIFETFQDTTIASVLVQHFWFQINKDDGMSEWLCETCWSQTKTFHDFYKRLELRHQNLMESTVEIHEIKKERSITPVEEELEANLFDETHENEMIVKIEIENTPFPSKENSNDSGSAQSEADHTTDDENDESVEKPKRYNTHSRSEKTRQDAEIYNFFSMKCDICSDVQFETLQKMRKHYRQVHKMAKGYLTCCGNKYHSRYLMMDHIQYHVNPDAYHCDQCNKSFGNRNMLRVHIQSHVRTHKCTMCSTSFPSAAKLTYHVRHKHTKEKSPCDQCGKVCRSTQSLTNHIRNVHKSTTDHVCDVCGRTLKNKIILEIHKKVQHSTTPLPKVQCDICGAWLKHKDILRLHLRRHKDMQVAQSNSEFHNCPICDKKVQTKAMLTNHMRDSHGERKYRCEFCDKAFRTSKILKEHVAALHTGVDLYNCGYCDRTFKSNANMYNHRKKVHLAEWTRDKADKASGNQGTRSAVEPVAIKMDE